MPFRDDCLEADQGAVGALDTGGELVRLTALAEQLGTAELAVVVLVAERLLQGCQRCEGGGRKKG